MAHSHLPPPSYIEATQRPDWLRIVAPYILPRYYASLCLVSRRFYRQFAPLLWNDPIAVARQLRRYTENELEWYCDFILDWLDATRLSVRCLVQSLDLRGFAANSDEFSLDSNTRSITDTLGQLSVKLPNLRCILVDGHAEVNPNALARNSAGVGVELPLLLNISGCQAKIEAAFFTSPYFRSLVYLDISDIPEIGTTTTLLQTIRPDVLPKLRVLKIQGHGMSDSGAKFLFTSFKQQLWSLDLSRNSTTDEAFKTISMTFPGGGLRNTSGSETARSFVEGKLQDPYGVDQGGEFLVIEESECSGTFTHPDRYLVDAPSYTNPQNPLPATRLNGLLAIANDSADSVKKVLAQHSEQSTGSDSPVTDHHHDLEVCRGKGGITHLRLNDNKITASGISQLLRLSPGHFEHFECNSMLFQIPTNALPGFIPPGTKLAGILGAAYLFRPVFSSNLQVLRIHHSLVTNILSIETDHLSERVPTMISTWAAETFIFPRAEHTYPQIFTPDMNPRLRSLALTKIPRFSTGPLISKLVHFLKLLSLQERAIQDSSASTRHHPQTLSGLRHLTLEFEHDPSQELQEVDLSFDDGSGWITPSTRQTILPPQVKPPEAPKPSPQPATSSQPSLASSSQPLQKSHNGKEKENKVPASTGSTSTNSPALPASHFLTRTRHGKQIPIWIGTTTEPPSPHPAVNEYARLARHPHYQERIEPASPCHVLAGVPPGVYIFGAAWDAMIRCPEMRKPTKAEISGMVDVIGVIKQFRQQTRAAYQRVQREKGRRDVPLGAPHFFWTGEIRVERRESTEYYGDSKFWR
ncbi:hypothetical protein B0T16DRAFT_453957 [Cercophora newfieldiana]|uniref:Uncharacterized protein n=1 Tax=Cercophora newfieldiana TaxID=92897 RepID=A0AA40CW90_9PEZI|nr:hypothetical protein B0T16DRAFT_453957 [Cercophora newfieldiana]